MRIASLLSLSLLLPLLAATAHAKPELQMQMTAEKEVRVTEAGKTVVKRVPATSSAPGEVLIYTLHYKNVGDEKATAVKVDNPLPTGTHYVAGSAQGEGSQISFSADGGKSYGAAEQLSVQRAGKKQKATAADYTHIRWLIGEVKAGQAGTLGFRATVE